MYLLHNSMLYSQILVQKQTSSTKYSHLKLMVDTETVYRLHMKVQHQVSSNWAK